MNKERLVQTETQKTNAVKVKTLTVGPGGPIGNRYNDEDRDDEEPGLLP